MPDLVDMYRALGRSIMEAGGQSAWAAKHGVKVQFVSDILHGRRGFGSAVLRILGYEKKVTVTYERIKSP